MIKVMSVLLIGLFSLSSYAQSVIKVAIIDDFSHKQSHGNKVSSVFNSYKGKLNFSPEVIELNLSNNLDYDTEKMVKVATELKVNVINLSLGEMDIGYTDFNQKLYSAIKNASDEGIWVVVAAGNSGKILSKNDPVYPCMFKIERLICVGSSKNGKVNPDSNWGGSVAFYVDGSYKTENATSFSAPRLSQSIVLFLQNKPEINFNKETLFYSLNDELIFNNRDFEENLKFEYSRRKTASVKLPF